MLIPSTILLATGAALLYAARDALRSTVRVQVAAVIPKPLDVSITSTAMDGEAPGNHRLGATLTQAPGWIEPDPFSIVVPALAEGVVREVLVLEGQAITAGDVVARLVDDDARLAVRASEAHLAEREAEVEQARTAIATFKSLVEVERALAEELRDDINRKRELAGTGIGVGEFRRVELKLVGAVASIAAAEQVVAEKRAALARAQAAVIGAIVARDESLLRLERMTIISPVGGIVLARLVEPGARLGGTSRFGQDGMESAVLRVYDPAHLRVRVDVPLADTGKVSVGTHASVSTEALPDTVMRGVVTHIVHEANIQRNTVQFKVRLDNPPPLLKPEMLARVKFHADGGGAPAASGQTDSGVGEVGAGDVVVLFPMAAITNAQEGRADVWVAEVRGGTTIVRRRAITMRPSAEEGFAIADKGLKITDKVVLHPPPSLREGDRISPSESATVAGASDPRSRDDR